MTSSRAIPPCASLNWVEQEPALQPRGLKCQQFPPGCWSPRYPPPSELRGTAWGPHRSAHSTCQAETMAVCHLLAPQHKNVPGTGTGCPTDVKVGETERHVFCALLTGPASWWWPFPASPGSAAAECHHHTGCPSPGPVPGHYQFPVAGHPADTTEERQSWGTQSNL